MPVSAAAKPPAFELPINLGLNDGTHCPESCLSVIRGYSEKRTTLRNYTDSLNEELLAAIAAHDGVSPDNVFVHNGTGPILKQAVPHLIKGQIKSSPTRIFRHLTSKTGFPIVTPWFTYSKVPAKAVGLGLKVALLPLSPDNGWQLDPEDIRKALKRHEGICYIVNPNNPTGNVLIKREQLVPLIEEFPRCRFWIDEAYVQYVDPAVHQPMADLVAQYGNVLVARSFSFAYGLAGLRIGYLLGPKDFVAELRSQLTDYRLGGLQQDVAIAALNDADHVPFMQRFALEARAYIRAALEDVECVDTYDSQANFVLCRLNDGRTGEQIRDEMLERGVCIKIFAGFGDADYSEYFRLTIGLEDENEFMMRNLREVLG